jgi:hypothetical protein
VTRAENGSPIDSAIVRVPDFYEKKVATSPAGTFTAELPGGAHTVIVTFPGYRPDTASVAIADGDTTLHDVALVSDATAVGSPGAADAFASPPALALSAAHPNPTRGLASLDLSLARSSVVRATVFDGSGRRVRRLEPEFLPAGTHALSWDGADDDGRPVADGTYLFAIDAAGAARTTKITILR